MFSDGSGLQSQINSMIFPNASMANSEYNVMNSIETSQNSLRQAIMSVLKKKTKNQDDTLYSMPETNTPLDSRFTKSLQIHSPENKFSHREVNKQSIKVQKKRVTLNYNTTLNGHKNTVDCMEIDSKYYSHLFSGGKDGKIKVWHCTAFSPRTIVDDESLKLPVDR